MSDDLADGLDENPEVDEFVDPDLDEGDGRWKYQRQATRKRVRQSRRTRPRSQTIAVKRITQMSLRDGAEASPPYPDRDALRPKTRADCPPSNEPCPWVACKWHLYLDVDPERGSIKYNFPDLEPWELAETCALHVADRGGLTLEETGAIINITRERIRQVQTRLLVRLRHPVVEAQIVDADEVARMQADHSSQLAIGGMTAHAKPPKLVQIRKRPATPDDAPFESGSFDDPEDFSLAVLDFTEVTAY